MWCGRCSAGVGCDKGQGFVDDFSRCAAPGKWYDIGERSSESGAADFYALDGSLSYGELHAQYKPNAKRLRKELGHFPTIHFADRNRNQGHMWVQHGAMQPVGTPEAAWSEGVRSQEREASCFKIRILVRAQVIFSIALSLGIPSARAPRITHALHMPHRRTTDAPHMHHRCTTHHYAKNDRQTPHAAYLTPSTRRRPLGNPITRQPVRSATRSLSNSVARQLDRSATRSFGNSINSVTRWLGSLLSSHLFSLCNLTGRSLMLLGLKVYLPSATRTRKRVPTE
jgi:hypothetical protein